MKSCIYATVAAVGAVTAAETFSPVWVESGLHANGLGYRPMSVALSEEPATEIKKAPSDLVSPRYGNLKTGPEGDVVSHGVIVDFVDSVPTRFFVDANANGDLTDDPACEVATRELDKPDGTKTASISAQSMVNVKSDGKTRGMINFYHVRNDVSKPAVVPKTISYNTDFGVSGEVKIGDKTVRVVLVDSGGTTRFTTEGGPRSSSILWVDLNANGQVDQGESRPSSLPFEVDGKWWRAANMSPDGAFQFVETEKPAAAKPEVSKLDPGNKAPAFVAKGRDGKEIRFPDDYKGKVVLIDFWATWCGPCVAELPNVVKAYGNYHDKGMEVLGISLDKENMGEKLDAFTAKSGMPWPQIYDGKFWGAEVAKLYEIHAIPHMILVDGDSGVILANKTIRGEMLAPAIEKALAGKK